jgi:hypothetical protein
VRHGGGRVVVGAVAVTMYGSRCSNHAPTWVLLWAVQYVEPSMVY